MDQPWTDAWLSGRVLILFGKGMGSTMWNTLLMLVDKLDMKLV